MKLQASAKINIYLKVLGAKDDYQNNYHLLKMVNAKIDLYDEIIINENKNNELIFKNSTFDPKNDNLILKIVEYFQKKFNIKKKYKIEIKKNIPIMAGLGGGSSDAAEVIKYINSDNNLNLDICELEKIGRIFGADIPYCLHNEPCIVEGIGEIITPTTILNKYKNQYVVVINPSIELSTKDVFKKYDTLEKNNEESNIELFKINDLEKAAFLVDPKMVEVKKYLTEIIPTNLVMSGSGSTYITILDKEKSEYIYNKIKKEKEWFVSINKILEV